MANVFSLSITSGYCTKWQAFIVAGALFIRFFSAQAEAAPLFNVPKIKASLRSEGPQYRSETH